MADWLFILSAMGAGLVAGIVLWIIEDHADGRR